MFVNHAVPEPTAAVTPVFVNATWFVNCAVPPAPPPNKVNAVFWPAPIVSGDPAAKRHGECEAMRWSLER